MTKNRCKRTGAIISNTILVILFVVALLLGFTLLQSRLTGNEPALAGYRICIVMSGSMEPAVPVGSAVVVQPLAAEKVKPGDIITFRSENSGSLTTHRVARLDTAGGLFYTKGDANSAIDPTPVPAERLVGRVALTLPYAGYLLAYTRSREGLLALFALAMLIVAGGLLGRYTGKQKTRQQNIGGEVAAEQTVADHKI